MDGGWGLGRVDVAPWPRVSATVAAIQRRLLTEIITGRRTAGQPVRDREVAAELGVSRTPVREAMLLLRHAGVLEVAASRYTRVAELDTTAAEQLARVWVGLLGLLVDELLTTGAELDLDQLVAAHERARRSGDDPARFVDAAGRFYDHLVSRSDNPHLVRTIGSVAPALGVALASMPETATVPLVLRAQRQLIRAVRTRDAALARASVTALRAIAGGGGEGAHSSPPRPGGTPPDR